MSAVKRSHSKKKPPFDPSKKDWVQVHPPASGHTPENMVKLGVTLKDPTMQRMLERCASILDKKGDDYTDGRRDTDRLWNFRTAAEKLGISVRQAWGTYYFKHDTSVMKFARGGKLESEPIEERIADCINYLFLLAMIVEEEKPRDTYFTLQAKE